jgi:hypothetical protein
MLKSYYLIGNVFYLQHFLLVRMPVRLELIIISVLVISATLGELINTNNVLGRYSDCESALEAAHIISYSGTGTNYVANGLILRADIHTLFDLYLISINPTTNQVVISSKLLNTYYKKLSGIMLKMPADPSISPSFKALDNHYKEFLNRSNFDLS